MGILEIRPKYLISENRGENGNYIDLTIAIAFKAWGLGLTVGVPNNWILGIAVIVVVQVLSNHMCLRYWDRWGLVTWRFKTVSLPKQSEGNAYRIHTRPSNECPNGRCINRCCEYTTAARYYRGSVSGSNTDDSDKS